MHPMLVFHLLKSAPNENHCVLEPDSNDRFYLLKKKSEKGNRALWSISLTGQIYLLHFHI